MAPPLQTLDIVPVISSVADLTHQVTKEQTAMSCESPYADLFKGEWTRTDKKVIQVVIKRYRKGADSSCKLPDRALRQSDQDRQAWEMLHHANILPLFGTRAEPDHYLPGFVSPYYKNGSVDKYAPNLSAPDKLALIVGIAEGLLHMHNINIVHGNLSPNNVLVDDNGIPRLSDFCLSKILTEEERINSMQSLYYKYMAPELIENGPDKCSDVYSFAMVALTILTGQEPFWYKPNGFHSILKSVNDGEKPQRNRYGDVADNLWVLLAHCWNQLPQLRPQMDIVVGRLKEMQSSR